MKKVIFILVVLVFIGYSCKKERDSGSILPKINNLFYYDFVPDIVATVPRNDTLSYYLDVNNDGTQILEGSADNFFYTTQ